NGQVIVRTYNHVRSVSSPLNLADDTVGSTFTFFGGLVPLDAGSDFAASPVGGFEILPNPLFTDSSLTTITNVQDYVARDVVLDFANTCRREAQIIIFNDDDVEFNEDIVVELIPIPGNPPVNPFADLCNVTILTDDQPAGALDREWNPDNILFTSPSYNQ